MYYRVANPVVNSLKLLHWAKSKGWSWGPEKVKRYGTLNFDFPDLRDHKQQANRDLGVTRNGVAVVAGLVWDGDRNRFVGPAAPLLRGRPIFEVDAAWSKDFEALASQANQFVIQGGKYDYGHIWDMVVPEGCQAVVTLSLPQKEGPPHVVERKLGPGRQNIQFYFHPVNKGAAAKPELRLTDRQQPDGYERINFDLPHRVGGRAPLTAPIVHTLNPQEAVQLLKRALTTSPESITLDVNLLIL